MNNKILLVKPPFFSPLTPPLGLAVLKAFLEEHGFAVRCYDFNVDPELWGTHHKYFTALQRLDRVTINDGYSKLWYVLNAHWLAVVNGADREACARVLEAVIPMYNIPFDAATIQELIGLAERFFKRLAELTDSYALTDFSVVGTSTYTTSLAASLFFLRRAKQRRPQLTTVMGGGIFADDLALGSDNLTTLINDYPFIDYAVLGEGELLFLKVLQGEFAGRRVVSIADIGGKTLDMLQVPIPDFSDFNLDNYYHLTIEGARSCPFECSFCSETIQWGTYRKKPKGLLSDQVIRLADQYSNRTYFMGDSLMNPYVMNLSTELLERPDAPILYDGYLRADKIAINRERVRMWARSGMYRARLGIESASERVLNLMVKMTTPETISEVLKSLSNAGIRTTTYWIVGFPGETEQDFQETLDFIREHHRYIYELEAHPYYYYPYGQISSRWHVCESLYPEHVTEVIKFKWWDIVGVQPARQERYNRLRRLSDLSAELGLPNIYTMAERYRAEERWHLLHPLAHEVYQGTRLRREIPGGPEQPLPLPARDRAQLRRLEREPGGAALGYRLVVNKPLEPDVLAAALEQLGRSHEALSLRVANDTYTADQAPAWTGDSILSIYPVGAEASQSAETVRDRAVKTLAAEVRPEPGAALRVALIQHGGEVSEVVLLAHRALADAHSLLLFSEDLFRIYEQLVHRMEISLRPIQTAWTTFLRERVPAQIDAPPEATVNGAPAGLAQIQLDPRLRGRLFSQALAAYGVQAADVLTLATLQCLGDGQAEVDVKIDERYVHADLAYTAGALTHTYPLPALRTGSADVESELQDVRRTLKQLRAGEPLPSPAARRNPVLLNFEYLLDTPWLGGDAWTPQGFVWPGGIGLQPGYGLELTPVWSEDGIQVRMAHSATPEAQSLVTRLAEQWRSNVEKILDWCESYVMTKRAWLDEFGHKPPTPNLVSMHPEPAARHTAWSWEEWEIDRSLWGAEADVSHLVLAAFAALLSRLNGCEEVVILAAVDGTHGTRTLPLRLYPKWDSSFRAFCQTVGETAQHAYGRYASTLALFAREYSPAAAPVFDVGYAFGDAPPADPAAGVELLLTATCRAQTLELKLGYASSRFAPQAVERIGVSLRKLLQAAVENDTVTLGAVALDVAGEAAPQVAELAKDEFNF